MEQQREHQALFATGSGGANPSVQESQNGKAKNDSKSGWTKIIILAGLSTTLGCSLPVGYTIGVVNSPADIIKTFCNESLSIKYDKNLTVAELDFLWSCIVAIFLIGGALGSLSGSFLADKMGRKGGLNISAFLAFFSGLLFFFSRSTHSIEMLFIGRFLMGLASGLITSIMPMYLTELSSINIRGSTGVLCPLGITIGVLLGQIISLKNVLGNAEFWHICLSVYLVPIPFCSLIFHFLPESPKYLFVIKREPNLAIKELERIRNRKEVELEEELNALKYELEENGLGENNWTIKNVLKDKSLLLPLLLVCSLQAGQQFSGINAVFYYSVSIFQKAGLSLEHSQYATIGAGICNLAMGIISIYVMAKFNRRLIIQISLATAAGFLFLLSLAITYISSFSWMPYISIIGVLGFVLCYGLGLGPIPYFIGSELFEVGPRPSAMALGSMSNWGGNFLVGLLFPTMQLYIGAASFFIFGVVVVTLYTFVRFYLPETRGRDVSKIAHLCRDGFSSTPLIEDSANSVNNDSFQSAKFVNV